MTSARVVVVAVALAAATTAACSGSSAVPAGTAGATNAATQWWSGDDYCGLLQTVQHGGSLLAGVGATDPARAGATAAFTGAVRAAAPVGIRDSWAVFGPALDRLVGSAGKLGDVHVDPAKVSAAAKAISADARVRCHLDLSA